MSALPTTALSAASSGVDGGAAVERPNRMLAANTRADTCPREPEAAVLSGGRMAVIRGRSCACAGSSLTARKSECQAVGTFLLNRRRRSCTSKKRSRLADPAALVAKRVARPLTTPPRRLCCSTLLLDMVVPTSPSSSPR